MLISRTQSRSRHKQRRKPLINPQKAVQTNRATSHTHLGKGVIYTRVVVQGDRPAIGGVFVGAEPVLPHDDGIGRDAADLLDETGEMPGDLGIGRPIVGHGRGNGLRLAEFIDLHHPRHNGAPCRFPDQRRCKSGLALI